MSSRPLFTAFGIPVRFDPFFVIGAFLFYSWAGGGRAGAYTVIAMVGFVLIHEFGHALTVKGFGGTAAITVTFLGGFAAYAPGPRHTTRHRVLISLMGPLAQLLAALPVLWFLGMRMDQADTLATFENVGDMIQAVAWAGVFLAFLNLIPLWPLDGGHIAERLLAKAFGDRVERPFLIVSLGGAILMGVLAVLVRGDVIVAPFSSLTPPDVGPFALRVLLGTMWQMPSEILGGTIFLPLFIALGSYARLAQLNQMNGRVHVENAPNRREMAHEEAVRATRLAERASWTTGTLAPYPTGWVPSPWVRAHVDLLAGRHDAARHDLVDLATGEHRRWLLDRVDRPEIDHLLTLVPPGAASSLPVLEARVHHGSAEDLVALATTVFLDDRSAEPLYLGAAGLAVRGLDDAAMQWLERAVNVSADPHRLAVEREYRSLHKRPDFQQLLGRAERSAGLRTS